MLNLETAEESYGPVIKTILPGQSFGELALLQPNSLRTATVVATQCMHEAVGMETAASTTLSDFDHGYNPGAVQRGGSPSHVVMLLRITQVQFDEAVTSLQAAQLEDKLKFLMQYEACS